MAIDDSFKNQILVQNFGLLFLNLNQSQQDFKNLVSVFLCFYHI